jgi:hypothetical protein
LKKNILSRVIIPLLSLSSAIFLAPRLVYADDAELNRTFQDQRRFIEEEYINKLRKTEEVEFLKKEEKVKFESGGLLSNSYNLYRNLDNDPSIKDTVFSILTQELWVWGKATFANGNYAYIRGRDSYSQKQNSSVYTGIPAGGNNEGPSLNMAYLSLRHKEDVLSLGRQYFIVGRGIAYKDMNDGIQFTSYSDKWLFKFLFARSLPHEDNVDYSVPGYNKDGNDRYFFGGEVGYLVKQENKIYLFFLMQKDRSRPHPADAQNYRYDSQYFGSGFTGLKDNFTFRGEIIKETGRSHTDSSAGEVMKKPIDAWAALLGVRYKSKQPFEPASDIEIAYGSGDKDRSNVTNTKDGGNINSKDTNFLYFGGYAGGYALSPRLSNLYIYKFDQSLKPFYFTNSFKDITVGAKILAYLKDKKGAGISDSEASEKKHFVGTEFDFYFYWPITKDLNFVLRYGVFYPGDAYSKDTDSNTKYLYTRLTYLF